MARHFGCRELTVSIKGFQVGEQWLQKRKIFEPCNAGRNRGEMHEEVG